MSVESTTPMHYQQVQTDMHTVCSPCAITIEQFFDAVIPSYANFYCVSKRVGTDWRDIRIQYLEQIIPTAYAVSSSGANTYFAMSGYREEFVIERGKPSFRTQGNSMAQKSFWLDIDCEKKDAQYATLEDALHALYDFCARARLPNPIIIISGQGLHVYWPLTEQIPTEQWNPGASMLAELCDIHGLKVDTSRTCDSASVLRVPGTTNYGKDGIARPVYIHEWEEPTDPVVFFTALLAAYPEGRKPTFNAKKKARAVSPATPALFNTPLELAGNFPSMDTPADAGPCVEHCKQIREMGFASYTNWYNGMIVLSYCENGREVARVLSMQDTRFSEEEFQQRFNEAEQMGGGPVLCSTFESHDPARCIGCVWKGKVPTPKLLGQKVHAHAQQDTPGAVANNPAGQVTEDRIAAAFAARHKDTLRYCQKIGTWFEWQPELHVWKPDETGRVFHYVREACKALNPDDKPSLGKSSTAVGVERFAKSDPQLATTEDQWDSHILLLGTPGGVINLNIEESEDV